MKDGDIFVLVFLGILFYLAACKLSDAVRIQSYASTPLTAEEIQQKREDYQREADEHVKGVVIAAMDEREARGTFDA